MRLFLFRCFISLLLQGAITGLLPAEEALSRRVRVLSVTDGDIFKIGVRFIGVDAPETHHPKKPVQFYGKEAAEFLRSTISGETVRLELGRSPTDRYGRLLTCVLLPNGVSISTQLEIRRLVP